MRTALALVCALAMCSSGVGTGEAQMRQEVMPHHGHAAGKHVTRAGTALRYTASLATRARYLARHGGVTGTCAGCATRRMQSLSYALVAERFQTAGWRAVLHAVCIVRHESGGNPGAVNSSSGAAGLSQIEIQWHPDLRRFNLLDPVDHVAAFWRLTRHGRDFYTDYDRYAGYAC